MSVYYEVYVEWPTYRGRTESYEKRADAIEAAGRMLMQHAEPNDTTGPRVCVVMVTRQHIDWRREWSRGWGFGVPIGDIPPVPEVDDE